MQLFIAEKPSVAKAIIKELGTVKVGKGFTECRGNNTVTWCFGHLLEQAEPDEYLPDDIPKTGKGKKIWRMEDLPIFPRNWKIKPKDDKGVKAQLKVIKGLLAKADSVVNAGDPDREGQLLVDEILDFYNCRKPVRRFWVSAQDPESIRKGLQSLKPNSKFQGMKQAALGRGRADWLIGMNLTRYLTLSHADKGEKTLIAVGRVQTPTLALVAARDNAIKNFVPRPYYCFKATVKARGTVFHAKWLAAEQQSGLDESGRLIDQNEAKKLASKLTQIKKGTVVSFSSSLKKVYPPRTYSLADIQLEASNKYGLSAEETLNTCQSLYEKHKVASYPRTDCQYLPVSQFSDSPKVLAAIAKTCPRLVSNIKHANTSVKSAVWDDSKTTAHHGIIPTSLATSPESFSANEAKLYELISKRYIAQFFPPHEFLESKVEIICGGEKFVARGISVVKEGWKAIYTDKQETDADEEDDSGQGIPVLEKNDIVDIEAMTALNDSTKPPKAYTEGTLIAAMEKIHSIVDNPEFKKYLKDSDGIGTPATRAAIISELKRKNYLILKGKKIHATDLGQKLLTLVPVSVKNPILTAIFERQLKEVEQGKAELKDFITSQQQYILSQISKDKVKQHDCHR